MNADPIKTICSNLEQKLTETRDRKVTGRVSFEAHVNQGGIGVAKLKVITEEECNLKIKA